MVNIKEIYGKTPYAVEMLNITKTFNNGSIVANQDINMRVKTNTIHAIIGENGAGKSTLMSILFGIYKPDKGTIKINGQKVNFHSAQDATKIGLGMVHQHFKLVQVFSLLENIILGSEPTRYLGFLNLHSAKTKIQGLANKYNLPVNLNKKTENASVGEQQRVEILKLLYRDSDILIFDEPTAVLSDDEIKNFLKMLLDFKKQGKTIIIITHKLNEVQAVADEATVIRLGKKVGDCHVKKTSVQKMSKMMVGRALHIQKNQMLDYKSSDSNVVLKVEGLHVQHVGGHKIESIKGISFDVHKGEILGIAGIEDNGQTELALAIGGIIKPTKGSIKLTTSFNKNLNIHETVELSHLSVREIYKHGVSHVPEDRHKYGLLLDESVSYNCVAPIIDQKPFSKWGFLSRRAIHDYASKLCIKFDVRGSNRGKAITRSLSGGNQQKLVFAREIARDHKLIIYVQPTRGLDLGAIEKMHKHIIEDAQKGAAVILISYELDEIFNIASTIMVMSKGKIVYTNLVKSTSRASVGHYIANAVKERS